MKISLYTGQSVETVKIENLTLIPKVFKFERVIEQLVKIICLILQPAIKTFAIFLPSYTVKTVFCTV